MRIVPDPRSTRFNAGGHGDRTLRSCEVPRDLSVQLSDEQAERLERAVGQGRFETPDAAIRAGLEIILDAPAGASIGEAYRRAYTRHPQDPQLGEAGGHLMAEIVRADEQDAG